MPAQGTPGEVVTFYSYKGGTGRTMALANVACLLADRQRDTKGVLMVDWDLEAPGLHRFFRDVFTGHFAHIADAAQREAALDASPGLMELFSELDRAMEPFASGEIVQSDTAAQSLIRELHVERFVLETDIPSLSLIKAGVFDASYSARVNTFPWERLYTRSPWLITSLAEYWSAHYRYVLIDSRTGLADISWICTTMMPEKLVVVFTPNRQSLTGVVDLLLPRAVRYRKESGDLRPLLVYPLASRVEMSEPVLREMWRFGDAEQGIDGYEPMFQRLFQQVYDPAETSLTPYFDEVQIQHVPRYGYGETIAARVERPGDRLSLRQSYERFVEWLVDRPAPWETATPVERTPADSESAVADAMFGRLRADEQQASRRVLTRLVRLAPPDEGGENTRWRVASTEMGSVPPGVVEALNKVGLVVPGVDGKLELASDSLTRNWRRLREWLDDDREFLLWRQRLREPIAEWVRTGRTDALLRNAPLDAAEQWLAERPDDLNSAERLFIGESLRERAARRRLVTVSAGVAAFLVVVVVVELLYSLAVTADWPRLPLGVSRGALYLTVNVLALVQVYRWFARYVGITTTPTSVGPARRPAVAIPIVLGLLLAGLWYIGTAWPDGSDAILPWGTLKISEYLSYQVTVMATVFLGLITFALMRSAGQWTDRLFAKFSLGFYAAYFATCALIVVLVILILIGVFPRFIRY